MPHTNAEINADGIFAKIIRGEIPSFCIYQDEYVYAFLDIGPIARGHCLVIPKKAFRRVDHMDDRTAAAIGRVLPRIARAVLKATGASDFNILQNNGEKAGQAVEHVHFHIIPRTDGDARGSESGVGLNFAWEAGALGDDGAELRDAIVANLSQTEN